MDRQQGAVAEPVSFWIVRSERFLGAAEHLPAVPEMAGPRAVLLALAVECRLKGFLRAVRGGVPASSDLVHLAVLARHCGLALSDAQRTLLLLLDQARTAPEDGVSDLPAVRALCRAVSEQMPDDDV